MIVKPRREIQKNPDLSSISSEDGSADVMNEGFHEGWDSGHGLEEPSTSIKIYQKKDVSELNKHEHYSPAIHEEYTPAINHLAAPCEERFTQPPG